MAVKQTYNEPAKVKLVRTLPSLSNVEDGELFYDDANNKLALRTSEGWKYFTED